MPLSLCDAWPAHIKVHKVLTLTAEKRDQRDYKNSDENRLVKIKVKLEAN